MKDGIAEGCDAIIELTGADLDGATDVTAISGNVDAWSELLGLLDREVTGFYMHMR